MSLLQPVFLNFSEGPLMQISWMIEASVNQAGTQAAGKKKNPPRHGRRKLTCAGVGS